MPDPIFSVSEARRSGTRLIGFGIGAIVVILATAATFLLLTAPALVRADANRELNRVAELQAAQDAKDRAVVSAAFERSSAAADGDVFYSRAEKDAIVEPYRRGLARPPTKPVERIEDLAEAIAEVEEEDEEVARKRKEDFYNSQIRMGTMKVCVAPP